MRDQRFAKPASRLGTMRFAHGQFPHSTAGSSTERPMKRTEAHDSHESQASARLSAQTQPLDQRLAAPYVLALEIVQQSPALAYDLEETAPGVVILLVGLEMVGQLVDPCGQQRHLNFGRPGVSFARPVFLDDLLL